MPTLHASQRPPDICWPKHPGQVSDDAVAVGDTAGLTWACYAGVLMGYTDAPPGWWRKFIMASPARTAKLAVVRADGSPHVAPVWADLDGDQVVFMTSADTVKGKAILRDPRVSL